MPRREILDRIEKFIEPFRVTKGKGFRLKDIDPGDTRGLKLDKGGAAELLKRGIKWLAEEQNMLYAQDRWALLLVFQAMDAAGKDGTIKHVMSGVNPQGCQVSRSSSPRRKTSITTFSGATSKCLPERGRIGIFNRSYYEEVLVVRVHQEILRRQRLPAPVASASGTSGSPTSPLRGLPRAAGDHHPQVLPAPLAQGAEEALPGAARQPESTGSSRWRRPRAPVLGGLHGGLRGRDPRHGDQAGALVRGPGRQQVVHPARGGGAIVEAVERLDLEYPTVDAAKTKELAAARAALARET